MEFFKRIGRDAFVIKYKKQKMVFNGQDINTILNELQELGIYA